MCETNADTGSNLAQLARSCSVDALVLAKMTSCEVAEIRGGPARKEASERSNFFRFMAERLSDQFRNLYEAVKEDAKVSGAAPSGWELGGEAFRLWGLARALRWLVTIDRGLTGEASEQDLYAIQCLADQVANNATGLAQDLEHCPAANRRSLN
ncbi:MAG: hypothetical protein WCA78_15570 [Rhizomicrobium sp.]